MTSIPKALSAVLCAALLIAAGCDSSPSTEAKVEEVEPVAKTAEPPAEEEEVLTGTPVVAMRTTKGMIRIELYPEKAPKTVANFLKYVDRKFYDSTIFHRVLRNAIQGGAFKWDTSGMRRKYPRPPIENESDNGLRNERGMVTMARGEDPDSATSQFFINLRTNRRYDRDHPRGDGFGYCVFGKVIEGMDVADAIGKVKTATVDGNKDAPVNPVFIRRIRLES